jgi:hypothetical protein
MGIDISPFRCSSAQVEQIQLSPRGFTLGVYIHALPPQRDPICAYGWLDYELLSSPSAIHVMTDLLGDCNNEVEDEGDDDEDGDDGEIGFAQPIRLNGGRILTGRAIPGMYGEDSGQMCTAAITSGFGAPTPVFCTVSGRQIYRGVFT